MKVYRVHLRYDAGQSLGYVYFTNKREAAHAKQLHDKDHNPEDSAEIHELSIPISRQGILMALRTYANHPDNG